MRTNSQLVPPHLSSASHSVSVYILFIEVVMSEEKSKKTNSNAFTSISNANSPDGSGKKMRKPYTTTKSRESWTEVEHDKFIEALQLFDRDWKKIEDFVASKTVIQIRSHAQKYFLKVQKNGTVAHVPPPRPKRKATHPYPQKTYKNVSMQLPFPAESLHVHVPACDPWDDVSLMTPKMSNCNHSGVKSSTTKDHNYEITSSMKRAPVLHAAPDFAEVYSFIGGIFDPETEGHAQKLKEMDPINFEAVLLLMKNLTINMSSPDFEPTVQIFSSYDVSTKNDRVAPEIDAKQTDDLSCRTT